MTIKQIKRKTKVKTKYIFIDILVLIAQEKGSKETIFLSAFSCLTLEFLRKMKNSVSPNFPKEK